MVEDTRSIDVKKDQKIQLNEGKSPSVKLKDLKVCFGSQVALQGVNLEVASGEFLVLLGPSGSGKSTLIRVIAGIQHPSSGEVFIGDRQVAGQGILVGPEERGLGMVFQDYALWPHMSVQANVAFALKRKRQKRQLSDIKVAEMLERVGLADKAKRYPSELSGGEQQRVALARALVADPGLLLFDEPLSNLDADLRERLRIEISTLCRQVGATVIYITHDQFEAFALADKVGVLQDGVLIQLDKPEIIYKEPVSDFVANFTGLSGEITAYVSKVGLGSALVTIGEMDLDILVQSDQKLEIGDCVKVLVRPSAIYFVESHQGLEATVVDVAFRGRGYDHVVSLANGEHLVGVFSGEKYPRQSKVWVGLEPQGCILSSKKTEVLGIEALDIEPPHPIETAQAIENEYLELWLPQD